MCLIGLLCRAHRGCRPGAISAKWGDSLREKKKTTPRCRLFLFRGVIQVSLPEFVGGKCTHNRADGILSVSPDYLMCSTTPSRHRQRCVVSRVRWGIKKGRPTWAVPFPIEGVRKLLYVNLVISKCTKENCAVMHTNLGFITH